MAMWKKMNGSARRDAQRRWRDKKRVYKWRQNNRIKYIQYQKDYRVKKRTDRKGPARSDFWVLRRLNNLVNAGVIIPEVEDKK